MARTRRSLARSGNDAAVEVKPDPSLHPHLPFVNLPRELLRRMSDHLDRTSLVHLSRAAKGLTFLTDLRLWEALNLYLPDEYGERPLVQPYARGSGEAHTQWAKTEAKRANERYREGLKTMIRSMMRRGGDAEWAAVRSIQLDSVDGPAIGMLAILELCPNLEHLELVRSRPNKFARNCARYENETFDNLLLGSALRFPRLTSLTIAAQSFSLCEIVPHLINASPSLVDLNISFDLRPLAAPRISPPRIISLNTGTLIEGLRFTFEDVRCGNHDLAVPLLEDIASRSPFLETLSMPLTGVLGEDSVSRLLSALSPLSRLKHLSWPIPMRDFCNNLPVPLVGFRSLKSLLLGSNTLIDSLTLIPVLPSLEYVHLEPYPAESTLWTFPAHPYKQLPAQAMPSDLARQLRGSRVLRAIIPLHESPSAVVSDAFDPLSEISTCRCSAATIRSVRYGACELLHYRICTSLVATSDAPASIANNAVSSLANQLRYRDSHGAVRSMTFINFDRPFWQDYTDWEGLVVPLDIIEKMRVVQGATWEEWDQRGVQATARAWKVLKDWKMGKLKEIAK